MKRQNMWKTALASVLTSALLLSSTAVNMAAFATTGEGASFLNQLNANYNKPKQSYATEVRWWLPEGGHTDETIKEEINMMYEQGFTGFELCQLNEAGVDADVYGYGSESWAHDVKVAIQEAAKLGMSVGLTSGTNWTHANIPGLDPNSEAAGQEIGISIENVAAGQKNQGTLILPAVRRGVATEDVAKTFVGTYAYRVGSTGNGRQTILDTTVGAINLTEQVVQVDAQTWTLDWTAPDDGDYVIYSMWQQGTFQSQEPAQENSYAINYYNTEGVEALKEFLTNYYFSDEELVEAIRSADVQFFMDSLEISTSQGQRSLYWSNDMRQDFIDKKGYDIVPYLPLLYGISTGSNFTGAGNTDVDGARIGNVALSGPDGTTVDEASTWKIANDLYDVHTQLIQEKMMQPLKKWAKENYNMTLRSQMPYGTYMETSEMGMAMDYVETETLNMKDQTDTYRLWSGAAHIMDTLYSSETACVSSSNYVLTEQDYIKIANLEFAAGVNRVIWHGHASSWGPESNTRWPGYEGMGAGLSTRLDSRNPDAKDYTEMNDYYGRVQQLLREGVSRTDLGILHLNYGENTEYPTQYADWIGNHQGIYWTDMSLQNAGYTYDYFSPDYLNLMEYDAATGTLGATVGYQAILVQQQRMPIDAAQRLLELAKQGLKVIIVDDAATITPYYNENNEDLKVIIDEVKQQKNVVTVASEADAYTALQKMEVRPRAELVGSNEQILTQVREDEGNNLYLYAYNYCDDQHKFLQYKTTSPESHGTTAKTDLSVDGMYIPYQIDPWTGEVEKVVDYRYENGRTVLNLSLSYNDVALLAFEPVTKEELHVVSTDADVTNQNGDFTVRAVKSGSYNTTLSNGDTYVTALTVPQAKELTNWDLAVENWTASETKEKRSETRSTTVYDAATNTYQDVELTTEEVLYQTNKDVISTHLETLTTWDKIEEIGKEVSGIGVYTTTFDWDTSAADGAYLDLGTFLQNAVVEVNGQRAETVDVIDPVIDLAGLLKDGENTLKITTTSTLANRMLAMGRLSEGRFTYDGVDKLVGFNGYRCTYQSNGLSSVTLVPYAEKTIALPEETLVLSATAPESAVVNQEFDVTVITPATVTDLKITDEAGKEMPYSAIQAVENEDGTKTWTVTMAVDTAGNDRTFRIAAKGKAGYFIDSGVTFSLDILPADSSSSESSSSSGSESSDGGTPITGDRMPLLALMAVLLAGAGVIISKRKNHKA